MIRGQLNQGEPTYQEIAEDRQRFLIEAYALARKPGLPEETRNRLIASLEKDHLEMVALVRRMGQTVEEHIRKLRRIEAQL